MSNELDRNGGGECGKCATGELECGVCGKSVCKECVLEEGLYMDYMPSSSLKRRVFVCHLHHRHPIRTYDVTMEEPAKPSSEADVL